ncbi:MAG: terpene cyclase/mutase family protein [Gemmataceae bacterium]|nr:terpene cyclase/mutase family protein [Gemmataceae bacterium]
MKPLARREFLAASAALLAIRPIEAAPDAKSLEAVLDKARDYLKMHQKADGSFAPPQVGEPGIAALTAAALIRSGRHVADPTVAKALKYLETSIKPDGGVYNRGLVNYTTSLAVMAFHEANADRKYDSAIAASAKFLRSLQYGDGGDVDEKDAKFGGTGYDKKGARGGPDLSNTHFFLEALAASGASKADPAFQRALSFLSRSQNLPGEFNDLDYAKKAGDEDKGGFVYNVAAANDPKSDKRSATGGLRSEGGMTYSGLKSFLYAGVSKDDPRVKAAIGWIRRHYTLKENPGLGQAGLYYYYHVFAKAMHALGEDPFVDAKGVKHDWRKELFETLKEKQKADGSWANDNKAFAENLPELATAFAVLALSYCKA